MSRSSPSKFRPVLETIESRMLPSGSPAVLAAVGSATSGGSSMTPSSSRKLTIFRITNPTPTSAILIPPLDTVRVQQVVPKVGGTYNITFVTMRNGTDRTYTAADNLSVTTTGNPQNFPILTGNQTWAPNQVMIFYILTKKYYPFSPQYNAGFVFKIEGSKGLAIPGPSGIFLRIKYDPATIDKILNYAAIDGPKTKGNLHLLGIGDTAQWEFAPSSSKTSQGPNGAL